MTRKNLELLVKRLNAINGFENPQYYTVGSYRLHKDGIGYAIQKVCNEAGGVSNVGNISGMTTKECYFFLSGLLANL